MFDDGLTNQLFELPDCGVAVDGNFVSVHKAVAFRDIVGNLDAVQGDSLTKRSMRPDIMRTFFLR